jgi:hypothetical protein
MGCGCGWPSSSISMAPRNISSSSTAPLSPEASRDELESYDSGPPEASIRLPSARRWWPCAPSAPLTAGGVCGASSPSVSQSADCAHCLPVCRRPSGVHHTRAQHPAIRPSLHMSACLVCLAVRPVHTWPGGTHSQPTEALASVGHVGPICHAESEIRSLFGSHQ